MNRSVVCRRLILALAAAFVISAWVYYLATLHLARRYGADLPPPPTSPVVSFFGAWGGAVLAGELVALAVTALVWMWAERAGSDRASPREASGYNGRDSSLVEVPRASGPSGPEGQENPCHGARKGP